MRKQSDTRPVNRRGRTPTPLWDRFHKWVPQGLSPEPCHEWLRKPDRSGRRFFRVGNEKVRIQRVCYELYFGPVPPGMAVETTCRNLACVNPSHLRLRPKGRPRVDFDTRFDNNCAEPDDIAGCVFWKGALDENGYGWICEGGGKGRNMHAHRAAWLHYRGPIPPGWQVCHNCSKHGAAQDNKHCVNVEHLFIAPPEVHHKDTFEKKQHTRGETHHFRLHPETRMFGERHGMATITDDDVREIRRLRADGMTLKAIAELKGLGISSIHRISKRLSWTHVK